MPTSQKVKKMIKIKHLKKLVSIYLNMRTRSVFIKKCLYVFLSISFKLFIKSKVIIIFLKKTFDNIKAGL
jgi:hypothetical protein